MTVVRDPGTGGKFIKICERRDRRVFWGPNRRKFVRCTWCLIEHIIVHSNFLWQARRRFLMATASQCRVFILNDSNSRGSRFLRSNIKMRRSLCQTRQLVIQELFNVRQPGGFLHSSFWVDSLPICWFISASHSAFKHLKTGFLSCHYTSTKRKGITTQAQITVIPVRISKEPQTHPLESHPITSSLLSEIQSLRKHINRDIDILFQILIEN